MSWPNQFLGLFCVNAVTAAAINLVKNVSNNRGWEFVERMEVGLHNHFKREEPVVLVFGTF